MINHNITIVCMVSLVWLMSSCGPTSEELIGKAKTMMTEGNFPGALITLNQVIDKYPDNQPAYNMRGIALLELGETSDALRDFNMSVNLDSGDYRAVYNRGNAYYQLGEFEDAIKDYSRASRLEPKIADIYINRGNALVQIESFEEAIYDYQLALKIDQQNYLTHFNLGRAYYITGRPDDAKSCFERCSELYSAYAPAHYFLGMIALEKDDPQSACLHLHRASELGYRQATEVIKVYCEEN